jgi:hypothetical protein
LWGRWFKDLEEKRLENMIKRRCKGEAKEEGGSEGSRIKGRSESGKVKPGLHRRTICAGDIQQVFFGEGL